MTSSGIGCDLIRDEASRVRPDAGLQAFNRERATDRQPVLDIEARAAELFHLRRQFHDVAEPRRGKEARTGVDERNADDPEDLGNIGRLYSERRLEQRPGAPVEEFEKAGIENDTSRIAMTPLDRKLPPAEQIGHGLRF